MIVALAGGVGAAQFLRGLVQVIPPETLTIISNTGDDIALFGLWISPDAVLETRLIAVETALHKLPCRLATLSPVPNWLDEIIASCKGESAFAEGLALGGAFDASQPYPDESKA